MLQLVAELNALCSAQSYVRGDGIHLKSKTIRRKLRVIPAQDLEWIPLVVDLSEMAEA